MPYIRTTTTPHKRCVYQPDGREPLVDQGTLGNYHLSWNPDDNRFYVEELSTQIVKATFRRWGNAVYYARSRTQTSAEGSSGTAETGGT